jgi:hypothetical protein
MTVEITREQGIKIIQDHTSRYKLGKLSDEQLVLLVEYLTCDNCEYRINEKPVNWDEYYKNQFVK